MMSFAHSMLAALAVAIGVSGLFSNAHAQFCPPYYAPSDRAAVREIILTDGIRILLRLHGLALSSTAFDLDDRFRRAFDTEYRILSSQLSESWSRRPKHLRPRTKMWLEEAVQWHMQSITRVSLNAVPPEEMEGAATGCSYIVGILASLAACL